MILPDVNILVHAHHSGSSHFHKSRDWWDGVLNGEELIGLPWVTILAFIRITTNRKALPNPLPLEDALSRVETWLDLPNVRILHPSATHRMALCRLLRHTGTAGNLTTDAHLAALAIEHGAILYTADNDFARFPDLNWRNPLN
jgi:uncharacterized protein